MILYGWFVFFAFQLSSCWARSVTYPGIGSFTDHDFLDPIRRPIEVLPQSPEELDPTFALYTYENANDPDNLKFNDTSNFKDSHFNATLKTKIIIPGFVDRIHGPLSVKWMEKLKDEWLKRDKYNVIISDWPKANFFPFTQATANVRVLGPMIAIFIQNLCEVFPETNPGDFHLMGLSLGAHAAGFAGKFLNGELGHITGFDPTGIYFKGIAPEGRLWHTDAKFVEAIHADARNVFPTFGFGMYENCAHVDYYPNGGKWQPGCNRERLTALWDMPPFEASRFIIACNHQRSVDFYTESINANDALPLAYQCETYEDFEQGKCRDCGDDGSKCVLFGPETREYYEEVKNQTQGHRYFFATEEHSPFLKYQYFIRLQLESSWHNLLSEGGRIHLKMVDSQNDTESFEFKSKLDTLPHLLDHTYQGVYVLETDPDELERIEFSWTHGLINAILPGKMKVDHLDLVPLNRAVAQGKPKTPEMIRFVPEKNEISNHESVVFKPEE